MTISAHPLLGIIQTKEGREDPAIFLEDADEDN